jgi:hypothetical protein
MRGKDEVRGSLFSYVTWSGGSRAARNPAVGEKPAEGVPAGQHVVHGPADFGMVGHAGALFARPCLKVRGERGDLPLSPVRR